MIPRLRESGVEQADMSDGSTIAPARDARNHRGASRVLNGGTAVSPTVRSRAVLPLRSIEDIDAIEAAGAVVAQALDRARRACVAGVTTCELDAIVREHIVASGAQPIFLGYRGSASSNMPVRSKQDRLTTAVGVSTKFAESSARVKSPSSSKLDRAG